ncbi:hypothetical protein ACN42_g9054 [Penicillium freii]|uniref:Uncharacterized protein n=1 Tax=Penicillium freii TaxID=48697 RepID=A0A101MCT0_PENFR|nr:hypothetical protein ACN42_g9054 [Penicillium freii]
MPIGPPICQLFSNTSPQCQILILKKGIKDGHHHPTATGHDDKTLGLGPGAVGDPLGRFRQTSDHAHSVEHPSSLAGHPNRHIPLGHRRPQRIASRAYRCEWEW